MLPVLYSFRRCPYAIRARLALQSARIAYEMREVELRNKPDCMLEASPKGSVPVLVLPNGSVIDESWHIMIWSLLRHDPEGWLGANRENIDAGNPLIQENDAVFKFNLDRYKYADRYPDRPQTYYREQAELFLEVMEDRLMTSGYLLGDSVSIADAGIFPFVRQFAGVDTGWFTQSRYVHLKIWLGRMAGSDGFAQVMRKYSPWQPGSDPVVVASGSPF